MCLNLCLKHLNTRWFRSVLLSQRMDLPAANFDQWPDFSKLILFFLMFTGASAGSTTGAIKLFRVVIAGKVIKREHFAAVSPPRGDSGYYEWPNMVSKETIRGVCAFLFLYLAGLCCSHFNSVL